MTAFIDRIVDWLSSTFLALLVGIGLADTPAPTPRDFQGYAEGEYVRLAPIAGGQLVELKVRRGDTAQAGTLLYRLDAQAEQAAEAEATARTVRAEAALADLLKGKRPRELDVIDRQRAQAEASLRLSTIELKRQEELFAARVIAPSRLDEARSRYQQDQARVAELAAQYEVAKLAARSDAVKAAEAELAAARAAEAQVRWRLEQRVVTAPVAATVTDTLFEPGEYVGAGQPVVVLLPPGKTKVRFFVPEPELARVAVGDRVQFRCDGCAGDIMGTVRFVAREAEFTPPVVYTTQRRATLVFMVEAWPDDPEFAIKPGQPVDVWLVRP